MAAEPNLVYANSRGEIFDYPGLRMAARQGLEFVRINPSDLIPLPPGSELFVLPGTIPVAWDEFQQDFVLFDPGVVQSDINAVAAFMSPAYTQTALAAFKKRDRNAPPLPLFAYTAVGWWKGRFWVSGFRSDMDRRQDIAEFDQQEVTAKTLKLLKEKRHNRLIQHLGRCSLTYGCPAAKNFFLSRHEAPLPSSPACNARCLGCISLQTGDGPPAAQDRISFVPTDSEIAEAALLHLRKVKRAVVSFGQGCEGEPLMQADLLAKTVRRIRAECRGGTVNLNSNASLPAALERLIESGLDSIRISTNSVFGDYYHAYYRPKGYSLRHVLESWRLAREAGLHVSLNLFIMPGFTDSADHVERLSDLIGDLGLDLIQLRNHNIDPEWYLEKIDFKPSGSILGIKGMVKLLKERFPGLKFGYFNPPLRD